MKRIFFSFYTAKINLNNAQGIRKLFLGQASRRPELIDPLPTNITEK
jgi:hypothetical protein